MSGLIGLGRHLSRARARARTRSSSIAMLVLAFLLVGLVGQAAVEGGFEAAANPQGEAPIVRTELDTAEITVGGRVNLLVSVEHEAGTVVEWPDSLDLGPFEVLQAVVLEPEQVGERVRSAARLTLTAFELGELELPSFDLTISRPDSASSASLSTDAWTVTVASVGRDDSGDIRDIKGPLEIPRNWLLLLPWLAGLAALVAAGYWLYRRQRSRRRPAALRVPVVPPRPPHEVAYEALDKLERSSLIEKGKVKTYYIEVSDIIRAYVEGRYSVEAMEMATYEVMAGLEGTGMEIETCLEFERFFGECDLVKFAKLVPDESSCRAIVPAARGLVDTTKAVEPIVAPEFAATSSEAEATRG